MPSETLFSYTCVETAKAVRDALRRIAPVFSCTERPNAKGRYTVEGSSDLIGLMSLAAIAFPRDSGKAASKALRSVIRLQDDEINTSVACRPIMSAFNQGGAMVSRTTTIPITLADLPEHVAWFKRRVEEDAPSAGKIVRVTVDLAL